MDSFFVVVTVAVVSFVAGMFVQKKQNLIGK